MAVVKPKIKWNTRFMCAPDILHFVSQEKQWPSVQILSLPFVIINNSIKIQMNSKYNFNVDFISISGEMILHQMFQILNEK